MRFLSWLIGYFTVSVPAKQCGQTRALLTENNVRYSSLLLTENAATFKITAIQMPKARKALSTVSLTISPITGFPAILTRYKNRYGIILGLILLFSLFFLSQNIVWSIHVSGNESVNAEVVLQELADAGFRVGTHHKSLNLDQLRNRVLMNSKQIAWLSINMNGVVAHVEIREYMKGAGDYPTNASPCNIVASRDGQITSITVHAGERTVEVGQTVRAGELLISGIMDSQSLGVRYEHAEGEVFAYVDDTVSVDIPMSLPEKRYSGKEYQKISLIIFGKTINIFSNCRNCPSTCDKITEDTPVLLFGRYSIPISTVTETYREYEEQTRQLTEKEAVDLAMSQLSQQLTARLAEAELVSKEISITKTEQGIHAECKLCVIENIAKTLDFKISDN